MDDGDAFLAMRFDRHRERLGAVALRMLGSRREAEEALREARAAGLGGIDDWLTTVVARACVERLRARRDGYGRPADVARPERAEFAEGAGFADGTGLADGAGLADGVGLALLVVLESLAPDERLVFVLHDLFALPLPEVARLTGRTTSEAAGLARGARRHVRGVEGGGGGCGTEEAGVFTGRHRAVVERFLGAARAGDARGLSAALDPDVVAYSERGPVHGAPAVAEGVAAFARTGAVTLPALVDGSIGLVAFAGGRPVSAMALTLRQDRIVALDITTGPERVRDLDLAFPEG
ncbi:sigma factor-like helix-turn-helix DNA-binding protein [Streptomyces sp. NPDC046332]|uniref:sigma factor-like helix-turn-helix DNA-binding protein n=1 Tax=Streptomyces sp. NPDC046332 TaxID=3155133 RepID=UPI0033D6AB99